MTEPELGSGALREALDVHERYKATGMTLPEAYQRIIDILLSLSSPIEPPPIDASAIALEFLATCSKISLPTGNIPAPTTEEVRKLVSSLARPSQASSEIREALAELFELVESGDLVRDISRDGEGDWLRRMVKLTATLKKAQDALAPSRQGAGGK